VYQIKPMRPGAGVNKELPEVGNISITGIVNFHGIYGFFCSAKYKTSPCN